MRERESGERQSWRVRRNDVIRRTWEKGQRKHKYVCVIIVDTFLQFWCWQLCVSTIFLLVVVSVGHRRRRRRRRRFEKLKLQQQHPSVLEEERKLLRRAAKKREWSCATYVAYVLCQYRSRFRILPLPYCTLYPFLIPNLSFSFSLSLYLSCDVVKGLTHVTVCRRRCSVIRLRRPPPPPPLSFFHSFNSYLSPPALPLPEFLFLPPP